MPNSLKETKSRKRVQPSEPIPVQVVHQIVIPEKPTDIVGQKVTYNEKYLKKCKGEPSYPVPECGYFIITKAVLYDDCTVMVRLHPVSSSYHTFNSGTHIFLGNMKLYKENEVINTKNI